MLNSIILSKNVSKTANKQNFVKKRQKIGNKKQEQLIIIFESFEWCN